MYWKSFSLETSRVVVMPNHLARFWILNVTYLSIFSGLTNFATPIMNPELLDSIALA